MKLRILVVLMLSGLAWAVSPKTITSSQAFTDVNNNVLANGTIVFKLANSDLIVGGPQIVQGLTYTITLNASGLVPAATTIWATDQMTSTGNYYIVNIFNSNGLLVRGPENWRLAGASPIDLALETNSTLPDPGLSNPILSNPAAAQTITGFPLNFTVTPGVFTGLTMQELGKSNVGTCNSLTEFDASGFFAQGGTVGFSGCVGVPSGATIQGFGLAGFATNSVGSSAAAANGILAQARVISNDAAGVGANLIASDTTNGAWTNLELVGASAGIASFNGSGSTIYEILDGVQSEALFAHQPATFWSGNSIQPIGNAFRCGTGNAQQWNNCVTSFDGAAALFSFIGTTSSASGASDSQPIQGSARASGTADTNAQIIFVHAAPSGACPALATVAINVAATTNSTVLYTCASGTNWAAVTVP